MIAKYCIQRQENPTRAYGREILRHTNVKRESWFDSRIVIRRQNECPRYEGEGIIQRRKK
jgi:hypothetical protein